MDCSNKIIRSIEAIEYKKIKVIFSDGTMVFSDLSDFSDVYCFPVKNDWKNCSIDSYGRGIIWSSRFEVHIDQVVDNSYSVEKEAV